MLCPLKYEIVHWKLIQNNSWKKRRTTINGRKWKRKKLKLKETLNKYKQGNHKLEFIETDTDMKTFEVRGSWFKDSSQLFLPCQLILILFYSELQWRKTKEREIWRWRGKERDINSARSVGLTISWIKFHAMFIPLFFNASKSYSNFFKALYRECCPTKWECLVNFWLNAKHYNFYMFKQFGEFKRIELP